jgi:hypothetical protein
MVRQFLFFMFMFCCFITHADVVKKSKSGICHDEYSSYYNRTNIFIPYNTLNSCLNSGGKLPNNYKGKTSYTSNQSNKYARSKFGHGWADLDKDCKDSRVETLASQSVGQVQYKTYKSCEIKSGKWISTFTGNTIYNASDIDIDHVVPLKWAWLHGADSWSKSKRIKFANDPANLLSVEASLNRSKGGKGLDEWLPPKNRCQYIVRFMRVYKTYGSTLTSSENSKYKAIKNQSCKNSGSSTFIG